MYHILPVSVDCPFLIAPLVFPNLYLGQTETVKGFNVQIPFIIYQILSILSEDVKMYGRQFTEQMVSPAVFEDSYCPNFF